jgi:hypothetical protein
MRRPSRSERDRSWTPVADPSGMARSMSLRRFPTCGRASSWFLAKPRSGTRLPRTWRRSRNGPFHDGLPGPRGGVDGQDDAARPLPLHLQALLEVGGLLLLRVGDQVHVELARADAQGEVAEGRSSLVLGTRPGKGVGRRSSVRVILRVPTWRKLELIRLRAPWRRCGASIDVPRSREPLQPYRLTGVNRTFMVRR